MNEYNKEAATKAIQIQKLETELRSLHGTVLRAQENLSGQSYLDTVSWATNRAFDVEAELCELKGLDFMEHMYG